MNQLAAMDLSINKTENDRHFQSEIASLTMRKKKLAQELEELRKMEAQDELDFIEDKYENKKVVKDMGALTAENEDEEDNVLDYSDDIVSAEFFLDIILES